jgi:hypothetical protein
MKKENPKWTKWLDKVVGCGAEIEAALKTLGHEPKNAAELQKAIDKARKDAENQIAQAEYKQFGGLTKTKSSKN